MAPAADEIATATSRLGVPMRRAGDDDDTGTPWPATIVSASQSQSPARHVADGQWAVPQAAAAVGVVAVLGCSGSVTSALSWPRTGDAGAANGVSGAV